RAADYRQGGARSIVTRRKDDHNNTRMRLLKRIYRALFKPKSYLLDGKYEVVPAFEWNGDTYYMHRDPLTTLAGRGLTSMMFYEELLMRCDVDYLREYCAAVRA